MEIKTSELIKLIETAFEATPYPEFFDIEALKGYHWRKLPAEIMLDWRDSLSSLSFGEFRFFLPAFMIFTLMSPIEADTLLTSIIYYLSPPSLETANIVQSLGLIPSPYEGRMIMFTNTMSVFNRTEKHAIAKYILLYGELYPPISELSKSDYARAMDFWKEFLE